ncbi:hypothetical protein [Streptomyces anulatus]|uniref:hypothetical protein n=1 Tax=Streptomyces anulatus TaxID=1892 RepID=UPI001D192870|nr:hypothetical protein [Streptomyces anulatus]
MVGRPPHQADIDAVAADVRASPAADIERARRAFLDSAPLGELDADPIGARRRSLSARYGKAPAVQWTAGAAADRSYSIPEPSL